MTKRGWVVTLDLQHWSPWWIWRGAYPDPLPKWWSGAPIFLYWKAGPIVIRHYCNVNQS